jgi:tetratricopeptide (TPR) repeat protein
MNNLAITYGLEKKLDESEKLFRESLDIQIRTLGPIAPDTLRGFGNLATTLALEKRSDQAFALFEKYLQNAAKAEEPALINAHYDYATVLVILGRPDQALQHLQEAVKLGFADAGRLSADDDLKPLRADARFQALLGEIQKKQSATPSKSN